MTPVEVLKGARELIADRKRWTKGTYARDRHSHAVEPASKRAVRWSLVGSLLVSSDGDWGAYYACAPLLRAVVGRPMTFSDTRAHAEVLAVLDAAIAKAEVA